MSKKENRRLRRSSRKQVFEQPEGLPEVERTKVEGRAPYTGSKRAARKGWDGLQEQPLL